MLKPIFRRIFFTLTIFLLAAVTANADIVVVASKKSPVDSLDKKTIKKLWLGKARKAPGVGKVTILDQPEGSAIRRKFYRHVTNKNSSQVKAYWAKIIFTGKAFPPKAVSSDSEALELVRASDNTIAYIDSSAVDNTVKILFTIK